MINIVTHNLNEIIFEDSYILILGTMPSVSSRKKHFYYMNPNNRFYKVLASLIDKDFLNNDIDNLTSLLKKYHIALFDVIKQCEIINSSDSSIKNVVANDINKLIENSKIKHIFLNGKKAYELFIKYNPTLKNKCTCLPSTSPANASYSLEKLIRNWEVILKFIRNDSN